MKSGTDAEKFPSYISKHISICSHLPISSHLTRRAKYTRLPGGGSQSVESFGEQILQKWPPCVQNHYHLIWCISINREWFSGGNAVEPRYMNSNQSSIFLSLRRWFLRSATRHTAQLYIRPKSSVDAWSRRHNRIPSFQKTSSTVTSRIGTGTPSFIHWQWGRK